MGAPGALYMVDLASGQTTLVRAWSRSGYFSHVYAWSPDGRILSYLVDVNGTYLELHLLFAAGHQVLATGVIGGFGNCWPNFDGPSRAKIAFSPDGRYVSLETPGPGVHSPDITFPPAFQVFRVADGKLVFSRELGITTWSGTGALLFFIGSGARGLQAWDPSNVVLQLYDQFGFDWTDPSSSSDGARIAYTGNGSFPWVFDVGPNNSVTARQLSPQKRSGAAFLSPKLVWYAEASVNNAAAYCATPVQGYIYDLADSTEHASDITNLYDSWPHFVGQS
ncbi:MAG TPA: hypothetical protein VFH00_13485 [Candidatus Nitrosotalea sp.]|nr:hypothetical protein [Candidatus Nitrosotalea sp.]